jgi:murein tripeptide amidase MpaA
MAYMNVIEIEAAVESLATGYPGLTERIELPHLTHEGRRVFALRIGASAAAPTVLLLAGVHARELVPPDLMISMAADMLAAKSQGVGLRYGGKYFSASEISSLLDTIAIILVPCVNPDGRSFALSTDPMWRKNRNPAHGDGASATCGVDLNRNFDFLWDYKRKFASNAGVATSDQPNQPTFRGDSPASEPEVRNVVQLVDRHPEIRWMVDVHSYVPAIFHAWGSDQPQSNNQAMTFMNPAFDNVRGLPDDQLYREYIAEGDLEGARHLADVARDAITNVRGKSYEVAPAFDLYPTSGTSDDYCYSRHFVDPSKSKVLGFTIECGQDTFFPPWSEAENIIRETSAGLIAFMQVVQADIGSA